MKELKYTLSIPFEHTAVNMVKELTRLGVTCYYQRTIVPPRKLKIIMKLNKPSLEDVLEIGALLGMMDKL